MLPKAFSNRLTIVVHYFLHPSQGHQRKGAAIAVLIVYFVTLAFVVLLYSRLFHVLFTNNGFVPTNAEDSSTKLDTNLENRSFHRSCVPSTTVENTDTLEREKNFLDHVSILDGTKPPPPGIEDFYRREVFVCNPQGLPIWCPTCSNWKPDRTHHCSDVGRCVRKLDHFCPW